MDERSSKYWQERFRQMEDAQHDTSVQKAQEIQEQFDRSLAAIDGKINAWYQRLADNNGVSMQEARKMLDAGELKEFRWNVEEYTRYAEENEISGAWAKQLENASARVHISRLEALKIETQQEVEKLYGNCTDAIDHHIRDTYTSDFYHTAFEVQKGIGVGTAMNRLDPETVEKIVSKPWAVDGKNFSDRLWENKTKLINNMHNSLSRMCITGEAPDRATAEISKQMGVSKAQAGRVVMTESAAFANKARQDCMEELDVEQFEVVETLDSHTCETCGGMDGKHFPMREFEVGVTAPPFHPNCRGCTCPYFDDEFDSVGERAARGEDGKTYYVPADTTYEEWKKSFVDGSESDLKKSGADDAIAEYAMSRKEYDSQVQELAKLEREVDDAQDAYMDVMDTPQASEYEAAFNDKFQKAESLRQAIKDLKAELSGKEAKAVRQVEKNLAVKTGIPLDKVEMTGLQYDTADMVYSSYKTVLGKYPELKGQLAAFKYDGVYGRAYASCRPLTGEVQAHGIFANYDEVVKSYGDDVLAGFHPVGTDHNSVIIHELGHALDGYMTKQKLLGADYNQYGILQYTSKTAKDMTLKFLGFDKQEIANELKSQGLTLSQRRDILEEREKEFITQNVSKYAAENEKEFFAECFAEYMTSDKPRDAARIFGEIIDKALGR